MSKEDEVEIVDDTSLNPESTTGDFILSREIPHAVGSPGHITNSPTFEAVYYFPK